MLGQFTRTDDCSSHTGLMFNSIEKNTLCFSRALYNPKNAVSIDPMHKWLPMKNCFVIMKISPTSLV